MSCCETQVCHRHRKKIRHMWLVSRTAVKALYASQIDRRSTADGAETLGQPSILGSGKGERSSWLEMAIRSSRSHSATDNLLISSGIMSGLKRRAISGAECPG